MKIFISLAAIVLLATAFPALAETPEYSIVIKDHTFTPAELKVPAGQKVKLIVDNQDPTAEEFESHDMNREKIINGNTKATIFVGPLKPGRYHFFGEFNMDKANGYIVAE
jgi:plastocyanin